MFKPERGVNMKAFVSTLHFSHLATSLASHCTHNPLLSFTTTDAIPTLASHPVSQLSWFGLITLTPV